MHPCRIRSQPILIVYGWNSEGVGLLSSNANQSHLRIFFILENDCSLPFKFFLPRWVFLWEVVELQMFRPVWVFLNWRVKKFERRKNEPKPRCPGLKTGLKIGAETFNRIKLLEREIDQQGDGQPLWSIRAEKCQHNCLEQKSYQWKS